MPSLSKSQQRYMGMVRALQEGKLSPNKVSPKLRETAKEISPQDAHDFAITKHKGLPEHVKKAEGFSVGDFNTGDFNTGDFNTGDFAANLKNTQKEFKQKSNISASKAREYEERSDALTHSSKLYPKGYKHWVKNFSKKPDNQNVPLRDNTPGHLRILEKDQDIPWQAIPIKDYKSPLHTKIFSHLSKHKLPYGVAAGIGALGAGAYGVHKLMKKESAPIITPEIAAVIDKIFNNTGSTSFSALTKNLGRARGTASNIVEQEGNEAFPLTQSRTQPRREEFTIKSVQSPSPNNFEGLGNMNGYTYKQAQEQYITGFAKQAFAHGLNVEGTKELMIKAGFVKEAFLVPLLMRLGAMIGGGWGAEALGARLAARSAIAKREAAAAMDSMPGQVYGPPIDPNVAKKFNVKSTITPKINTWADRGNQILNSVGDFHSRNSWIAPNAGGLIAPLLAEPFISKFDTST